MIELPPPVAAYVQAANAHDAQGVAACFEPDATVRDEGSVLRGREAIAAWSLETSERYSATMAPVSVAQTNGKCRMRAKVEGNFPGSPVNLDFIFGLGPDAIASLEIA